jgi:AbrB family looped-hinge helix DNA binding protein
VPELYRAKLTGKGHVQVPKAVREALGAARGDDLVFKVEEDGDVYVTCEPRRTLSDLAGVLAPLRPSEARAGAAKVDEQALGDREEEMAATEAVRQDTRVVRESIDGPPPERDDEEA